MKVLAITVGGSPDPIVNAIRSGNPDYVLFFASTSPNGGSKRQLLETTEQGPPITQRADLNDDSFEIIDVPDPDDMDTCFQLMIEAMETATERLSPAQRIADYTGGTKTMSAALVIAALHLGWQLELVTGPRKDTVKVISGTESPVAVMPASVRFYQLEHEAKILFDSHAFRALEDLLENGLKIPPPLPSKKRAWAQNLLVLSRAFRLWDNFQYEEALEVIRPVARCCPSHVETLAQIVGKETPSYKLVSDLIGSAMRRAENGLLDDAVLRLYRAVELLAQIRLLREHGLDTGKLDISKIPVPLRQEFMERATKEGQISAGLLDSYRILASLDDPLGKLFAEKWEMKLKDLMQYRNKSFLTHGLKPIGKEEWKRAKELALGFIEEAATVSKLKLDPVVFPKFRELQDRI